MTGATLSEVKAILQGPENMPALEPVRRRPHPWRMVVEILLQVLGLGVLTVLVTRGVEALMPESVLGIALTGMVSALLVWLLASAGFAVLYAMQDARVLGVLGEGPAIGHFLRLGFSAGLVWAPILLLVVTTAPRRWKTAVW